MTTKQITLRLPEELYELIKQEAERKSIPIADLINIILYPYYRNVAQE